MTGASPEGPDDAQVAAFAQWVHGRFGHDFRNYQTSPLRKSLAAILERQGLASLEALQSLLDGEPARYGEVLSRLTVTTSSMFRNPAVFDALTNEVFPYLKTYSSLKIWHAGCARGEEVYALAILLKEHGLLDRTRIYATDINPAALDAARKGIYPARRLKEFARNYHAAGGRGHLSDHFELRYGHAKMRSDLSARILFSKHDLVTDAVFGEMQLILCRNVLIYFNPSLQQQVLALFAASLSPGGFLCLGHSESIGSGSDASGFKPFRRTERIFRATSEA